ncbi:DUF1569 domain-containing protein [Flavobacteriaceae bacterium M23B6Z8]
MQSLFEKHSLQSIVQRVQSISNTSERKWGSMTPAQMLWHCKAPLKIALRKEQKSIKINPVKKLLFRLFKSSLYNDKPWKHNLPTPEAFVAKEEFTIEQEKEELLNLIHAFYERRDQNEWMPHPYFGTFTKEQWGQMQFKHLDHHLKQFNT